MKRTLRPEEMKLWSKVASTVRLAPGRAIPKPPPDPGHGRSGPAGLDAESARPFRAPGSPPSQGAAARPDPVEPGRKRLLVRERTTVDGRLDLHGLDYDRARAALRSFIARAVSEGWRHVLIITGKGYEGEGVLRRFTPIWLSEPGVREHVAGVSPPTAATAAKGPSTSP
jgi:DNA-nicking Smr family endonuclease